MVQHDVWYSIQVQDDNELKEVLWKSRLLLDLRGTKGGGGLKTGPLEGTWMEREEAWLWEDGAWLADEEAWLSEEGVWLIEEVWLNTEGVRLTK